MGNSQSQGPSNSMTLEHKRYYEALDSGDFAAKWIMFILVTHLTKIILRSGEKFQGLTLPVNFDVS